MTTINQRIRISKEITLPSGQSITMRKLMLVDFDAVTTLLAAFFLPLSTMVDHIDNDAMRDVLPIALLDIHMAERRETPDHLSVIAFLQLFAPDFTADMLESMDQDDFLCLWHAIIEDNSLPFDTRRPELRNAVAMQIARLAEIEQQMISSQSSIEPTSTHDQQD